MVSTVFLDSRFSGFLEPRFAFLPPKDVNPERAEMREAERGGAGEEEEQKEEEQEKRKRRRRKKR